MKKMISMALAVMMTALSVSGCQKSPDTSQNSGGTEASETREQANTDTPKETEAQEGDIKIGVLVPLSGPMATIGLYAMEGTKIAFEQMDYKIGGKNVHLYFEDTQGDSTLCIQRASSLVEREGVDLIIGPLSGSEAVAMKDYAASIPDTTVIVAAAGSEDVTIKDVPDNVFRTCGTGAQTNFDLGKYAYETLGYKKILTIGNDYDFPFSQIGGFSLTYINAGGTITDKLWCANGTTDFSSLLASVNPDEIDAVFVGLGSSAASNFLTQWEQFGFAGKIPLIGGSTFVDTAALTTDVGYLLEGVYSGAYYAQTLPYEEFTKFNDYFYDRNGYSSSLFAADYYIASQVAAKAIETAGGNMGDQKAFREALLAVEMDTPRGKFSFDDHHNAILNVYINQVQKVDDEYKNVVIETFENVSQYGPFDAEWYRTLPTFDRNHPTVDECLSAKEAQ